MSDIMGTIFASLVLLFALLTGVCVYMASNDLADFTAQHREVYGLGATVTTTDDYEALTNDSFTGVVVGGDCVCDQLLTIRNRDGVERVIAIDFLEHME